jgi:hypothetical protein
MTAEWLVLLAQSGLIIQVLAHATCHAVACCDSGKVTGLLS